MSTTRKFAISGAAAALAMSGLVLSAPSASANATTRCASNDTAYMCVEIPLRDGATPQAYGSIIDRDGGYNLSVKVRDIKVQQFDGSVWRTVRTLNDYDGWAAYGDSGMTTKVNACGYRNKIFRAVASFDWKKTVNGKAVYSSKTLYSGSLAYMNC